MGGPAGRGGVPVTGPDLARFTDPDDGGLRHHHLLLQAFLRQGCGWAAAFKGLLGVLGGRAAFLPVHLVGCGAGRHEAGLARGEVLLAGRQVLIGAAVRCVASPYVVEAARRVGAPRPGEVCVLLYAVVPNVDDSGVPLSHHSPNIHAGVRLALCWLPLRLSPSGTAHAVFQEVWVGLGVII